MTVARTYSTTSLLTPSYSLGFCTATSIVLQVASGLILATDYLSVDAFTSCASHLRDLDSGFLTRTVHSVGVSITFLCVYGHIGRCLWYSSSTTRGIVWSIGVSMYLLLCGVCFTGYSLIHGQMSLWAIVVISNLAATVLGPYVLSYMWGSSVVCVSTLTRFFVVHYLLPLVIIALIVIHLLVLHSTGSTGDSDVLVSRSYYVLPVMLVRDLAVKRCWSLLIGVLQCLYRQFRPPDNWVRGNTLVTPALIAPEWYLLPFYGVLRGVPSKLYGVALMCMSLVALIPILGTSRSRVSMTARVVSSRYHVTTMCLDATLCGILCLQCNSIDVLYGVLITCTASWFTTQLL